MDVNYMYCVYTSGMRSLNEAVFNWNGNEGGTISGVTLYWRTPASV